ncbi:MAG: carboxypeptidase-like regulatory domain-containing protein [Vicinamibacterales bacterium]
MQIGARDAVSVTLVVFVIAVLLPKMPTASGQSEAVSGRVEGSVVDDSGTPFPGTPITVLPEKGGLAKHQLTDQSGRFHIDKLSPGTYRVDAALLGFDGVRQNHVLVSPGYTAQLRVVLRVRPICECLNTGGPPVGPARLSGQVLDEAGNPLPHAWMQLRTYLDVFESMNTDDEGRFELRTPLAGTWPLTASDTGFAPATQIISSTSTSPLTFRLRFIGTTDVPVVQRLRPGCSCGSTFLESF